MELNDFLKKAEQKRLARSEGRGLREGVMAYRDGYEQRIAALPVHANNQTALQNPQTGAPYFTLDMDGLDDANGAGLQ